MRRFLWILSICILLSPAGLSLALTDLVLDGSLTKPYYGNGNGNVLTGTNCTVPSGSNVTVSTFYEITLNPGFETMSGSIFNADINNQTDIDSDGLPDWWEYSFFGDLSKGPNDDPDGDHLTNLQEYQYRTDPTVDSSDSDTDGLPDWWELSYFGNLNQGSQDDFDNDGVSNELEFWTNTNPADPNSKPKPGTYYQYDIMGRIKKVIKVIPQ